MPLCPSPAELLQPWSPAQEGPGAAGTSAEEAPGCSEGWSSSAVGKAERIGRVQEKRRLQGHLIVLSST